jgi:hypothetical protein
MIVLSSLLLLASQPAAAQPIPAEIHNFDDWVVACDNGMRCQALSLAPEPKPASEEAPGGPEAQDPWERFGQMMFERGPEPGAPLVVTISDFEGTPARLLHYDSPLEGVRISATEEGEWRLELSDPRTFVDMVYAGTFVVQDAAGNRLTELALDGAYDSLLYMDERQGRLRTPTAMVRRGNRPLSLIPPPPPLPVVTVAPRPRGPALNISKRRLNEARREQGCGQEEVGGPQTEAVEALGEGRALIMMSCGSGAYNFNSLPLIAWRQGNAIRIEPAKFDLDRVGLEDEDKGHFLVTNAEFDADTLTISEYAKGRGLGDCGVSASYAWDGTMFRMTERSEMSECRGTRDLLTTWRTERR